MIVGRRSPFMLVIARVSSLAGVLALAIASPALAQEQTQAPDALTLAEVEALALAHNPTLAQAGAQVDAARGRATQAGLLPNPTIGYAGEDLSRASHDDRGDSDVRGSHGFFVEQTIPLGGKLARGRAAFITEAQQAEAIATAQRLRVLTAVRLAYREAVIAARRVTVRERLAQVATEAVQVSTQLFNVGAADRPDTLEADIEARRAGLALIEARNAHLRVWRQLGALIGDPGLAPRPLAATTDDALPAIEEAAARARLLRDSPEMQTAQAGTARADAGLNLAKRAQAPDLFLRGGSRFDRERSDVTRRPWGWGATVEVGVSVPLFNRNQGGIASATADSSWAKAEVERTALSLESRAAEALAEYDTARQAVALYRQDILPRAEEAYTLYRDSYQQMAASYPQVLIAQRTMFQVTDQYLDAIGQAWSAAIRLEGLLLDGGLDAPPTP